MTCPHCGSRAVKADRSLAGRLVCGRCGRPLQPRRGRRRSSPRPGRSRSRGRGQWILVLLLLGTAAVVITQRSRLLPGSLLCWLDGGSGWIERLDAAVHGRAPRLDQSDNTSAARCGEDAI